MRLRKALVVLAVALLVGIALDMLGVGTIAGLSIGTIAWGVGILGAIVAYFTTAPRAT